MLTLFTENSPVSFTDFRFSACQDFNCLMSSQKSEISPASQTSLLDSLTGSSTRVQQSCSLQTLNLTHLSTNYPNCEYAPNTVAIFFCCT